MSSSTIFALATAPGKSGVAVVRISGKRALSALYALSGISAIELRRAVLVNIRAGGELIDRGLALYFKAPNSFTGEDVVELQLHGSMAVVQALLGHLNGMEGLRPAEAGEFTRRAFMNGKMDLLEAEGLADLIDAETPAQRAQALRQMGGNISSLYESLRVQIIQTLAHLEATIDFPDEDIPESVLTGLADEVREVIATIEQTLSGHRHGERLRSGINIVILGAPNAGKSSLINCLSKRDVAIVSPTAGTTRDMIEVHLNICGYPAVLVDTAGIRQGHDAIEEEGVRRALKRAEEADIKLVLFDGSAAPDEASLALLDEDALSVITKMDVILPNGVIRIPQQVRDDSLYISTQTGEGLENLLSALEQKVVSFFSHQEAPMITRERHRHLLHEALSHLKTSLNPLPLELKCEELRLAAVSVGKITGKISVDDVLDVVFRQFCIGK